jgi:hypothetical protein
MKVVNERSCLKMIQRIHCRACSFWNPTDSGPQHFGTCQRYAPRPAIEGADFEWAATLAGDWCGEAQPARVPHGREIAEESDWDRNADNPAARVIRVHCDEWAESTSPIMGQPCPIAEEGGAASCVSSGSACGGWKGQRHIDGVGECILCIPPD